MKATFRRVVIGATFHGCGLAAAEPDSLVVEAGVVVGWEFALALNPGKDYGRQPGHPDAEAFRNELLRRRALSGDAAYAGAFMPLLAAWCLEREVAVALSTWVARRDDHRLEVVDNEGRHVLEAEEILDARPRAGAGRRLVGAVSPADETERAPVPGIRGRFEWMPSPYGDTAYVGMNLGGDSDWPAARALFLDEWRNRPAEWRPWRLDALGSRFDDQPFPNPVAALDCGLRGGLPA